MLRIILLIFVCVFLYKVIKKSVQRAKIRKIRENADLDMKDFSGVSDVPGWWEFWKHRQRKKEIEKSKHIFMNTLNKQRRRK